MEKYALAKILPIVLVILFALIAGWNLFHPGLPPTHDGEYHVIRFYEFDKELRGGNLYPRWAPDLNKGYGVPLFNYVYPLPNYVASFFHFFGISFIDAFKLNLFFALLFAAVFMYLWAKLHWGVWGGVVAASFYTFAPYHLLDIYIRGSVGEVWALAFFPAFLWALTRLIKDKRMIFLPISSMFFSLVIFSHNILALMFFPFAISYCVILIGKTQEEKLYALRTTLYAIFLGVGISSIFWLPAILERQYVGGLEIFDYKGHFVEVYQLIFPSWGSGFSGDPTTEGLSFQIGIANLAVLAIVVGLTSMSRNYRKIGIVNFAAMWVMLSVFFMLPISLPLWERLPFIQYFQFPWRFLSVTILGCSFLAGSIVYYNRLRINAQAHVMRAHYKNKKYEILIVVFLLLSVVFGLGYTKPAYYHMRGDEYYVTRSNFIDGTNSPGNAFNTIWFNEMLPKTASFSSEIDQRVTIHKTYFPGWQVFVDGSKVETKVNKDGLIFIKKPREGSIIEIKFMDTTVRNIAKSITLASFVVFCLLIIRGLFVRMGIFYEDRN